MESPSLSLSLHLLPVYIFVLLFMSNTAQENIYVPCYVRKRAMILCCTVTVPVYQLQGFSEDGEDGDTGVVGSWGLACPQ